MDPLFHELQRDVRTYHRLVQQRVIRRLQYDTLRYDALDTYMDTKRRGLHRAAKMSVEQLDDASEVAILRARLVLDAAYEDVVRDLQVLQKDISDLAEENKRAMEALKAIERQRRSTRPAFWSSFDLFS